MKTTKILKKAGLAALACGLIMITACNKEKFEVNKLAKPDWSPSLAAPLAYSSVELTNLIAFPDTGDIQLQEDSNHFMTLYYESQIFSAVVSDFVTLDDQQVSVTTGLDTMMVLACQYAQFLGVDSVITLPPYTTTTALTMPNGAEIDSIELKSGVLNWNFVSDFRHDITIDIIISSATYNGVPYSKTIFLDYTGTSPYTHTEIIDLAGYDLDISETTNGTPNSVTMTYTLTVNYDHTEPVYYTDSLAFDMGFTGLDFSNVYGYLGNQVVDIPEEMMEFSTGGISMVLEEPKLTLTINNSLGLPIDAAFTKLEGGYDGGTISLSGVPNPIEFAYPRVGEEGDVETTVISLDASNSNLSDFLSSGLTSITFAGNAATNPDGNVGTNFVLDDGMFSVDMAVELPLYGSIANIGIVDTIDMDLSALSGFQSADFVLSVVNEFPFDINLQAYFVDENLNVLDSLMQTSQKLIESSSVDGNGELVSATNSQTTIAISEATLNNVKSATKIILIGSIATANGGTTPVKLYSDYKMDFDLGVKIKL